jgi:hypothetical protein
VKWKLRVGICRPDIWQVMKGILKWKNFKLLLNKHWGTIPPHPGEF